MTTGDLRELLRGIPDDVTVLIPFTNRYDGKFLHPCCDDSGLITMPVRNFDGIENPQILTPEEIEKVPMKNEPTFILVPCNFFEEDSEVDHTHELN